MGTTCAVREWHLSRWTSAIGHFNDTYILSYFSVAPQLSLSWSRWTPARRLRWGTSTRINLRYNIPGDKLLPKIHSNSRSESESNTFWGFSGIEISAFANTVPYIQKRSDYSHAAQFKAQ